MRYAVYNINGGVIHHDVEATNPLDAVQQVLEEGLAIGTISMIESVTPSEDHEVFMVMLRNHGERLMRCHYATEPESD